MKRKNNNSTLSNKKIKSHIPQSNIPILLDNVYSVAISQYSVVCVTQDNQCYIWGKRKFKKTKSHNPTIEERGTYIDIYIYILTYKIGYVLNRLLLTLPHKQTIKSVACGSHHMIVISTSGKLYGTGANRNGQLGIRSESNYLYKFHEIRLKTDDQSKPMQGL